MATALTTINYIDKFMRNRMVTRKVILDSRNKPDQPGFVYNTAQIVGNTVYISGQVATQLLIDKSATYSFKTEAKCVLENLISALHQSGSSIDNVVKTVCLLSDMEHYAEFNEVYNTYFTVKELKPARVCFAVKGLPLGARVEVECVAVTLADDALSMIRPKL